jgi:threonine aldolase
VFPVSTGTAANALSLATLCPPHGAVLCHAESHIVMDECAATEFLGAGLRLVGLPGAGGKVAPAAVEAALPAFRRGVHSSLPSAVSLTQATEYGTVYTPDEVAALTAAARRANLAVHMDGARFANALCHLGCSPADITWRAGVDVLCFGATKNGACGAEAVIFFDRAKVRDFEYRRKRSGHLLSKMRFASAQLLAYLANDLWLRHASAANAQAARLAAGLAGAPGVELAQPTQANEVFAYLPEGLAARLRAEGATFYDWEPPAAGRVLVRLVTSFATPEAAITEFLARVRPA